MTQASKFIRRLMQAGDRKLYREAGATWAFRQSPAMRGAHERFRPLRLQRRIMRARARTMAARLVLSARYNAAEGSLYGARARLQRVRKIVKG
jgi:hypothetical protein